MRYFGLWHGGVNYAAPDDSDLIRFDSLREAGRFLQDREDNRDGRTPCVESSELHLYASRRRAEVCTENGPDRVITMGPRGGVRIGR
jgi:hypothetical protein